METPVIVSACRTPIGKFGRSLVGVHAARMGAVVVREAIARAGLRPRDVGEVIMGNVISAGLGQNVARQSAIYAGVPVSVGSVTVNKVCGSGLKSVILAAQAIKAGDQELVVAGGTENMSNAPYLSRQSRWGAQYGDAKLEDAMLVDGLWDAYNGYQMGMTGERVARRHGVTRRQADEYACESQSRAARAQRDGRFAAETVPMETGREGAKLEADECVRPDTTVEGLSRLKPAFAPRGVLTAGNSSQLSDGASALVLAGEDAAERRGLKPLARVVAYETGGTRPEDVMEAPIPTVKALLKKARTSIDEVDLVEHNEAFSTASIVVRESLGVPEGRFNVNGGAVALGHPLGCSGARILTTLLYEMSRTGRRRGLATLCMGGGNALAMLIERC
ncbi:MAG: acetyl-CoA C-acyltransferase [Nitrososphaerota archaeon]|nr:acetyl-CoA C-acyltransferase [Nitrososphaerota archaeon]MDG6967391.1 acetyl-CoA C-acyltransferase [Nitrososphaerota archaeon]MDG6977822.1 acetyl-CoA C-acyltransferase [Nitrososphaerota archaeon]